MPIPRRPEPGGECDSVLRTMGTLLLLYNSPRVRRYFETLARQLPDATLPQLHCVVRRVGVAWRPRAVAPATVAAIIDYGMRRKRARPHFGPARLALYRALYSAAARLHYRHALQLIDREQPVAVGVWGGNAVDVMAVVCATRDRGLPCIRFENGTLPDTTQMDLAGVNADSSVPRDPAFYAARGGQWQTATAAAVVPRAPRRGKALLPVVALPARYVFVPFQVMLDSQVLLHSPWLASMEALFEAVQAAQLLLGARAPVVVFKEHPSCPRRYPLLHAQADASGGALRFANGNATGELIAGAQGVVTLNSSVGVESLLLGKPVLALGNAIYAIEGVALSARTVQALADWLGAVADDAAPQAPLRQAFLRYMADEQLLPGRHQAPTAAHMQRARDKLLQWGLA